MPERAERHRSLPLNCFCGASHAGRRLLQCEIFSALYVRFGSRLCENSSARRARRNISKKLRIMESNHAARPMFGTLLENCIFYILPMYEFLHSQGQQRTYGHPQAVSALPPKADK
jgi:hypothetical protein